MFHLELTQAEVETLKDILQGYLSDLRMEIADTDRMDFREGLKKRELLVKDLLQRLDAKAAPDR
ncbi:MAG: hypothetical protein HY645_12630 [Acidobacteria bacterium]|nr:hypothetical protein [Acidobacteriota bacterium]